MNASTHLSLTGNQQSKEWITLALLQLMENKAYSDIQITEIAKKSGLARQTFYRNFKEKDDILLEYLRKQFSLLNSELLHHKVDIEPLYIAIFQLWREHIAPSLAVNIRLADRKIRQLIFYSIEHLFDHQLSNYYSAPDATQSEFHHYASRSLSSVIHGLLVEWSLQNFKQSPESMGQLAFRLTESMHLHFFPSS